MHDSFVLRAVQTDEASCTVVFLVVLVVVLAGSQEKHNGKCLFFGEIVVI